MTPPVRSAARIRSSVTVSISVARRFGLASLTLPGSSGFATERRFGSAALAGSHRAGETERHLWPGRTEGQLENIIIDP